MTTTNTSRPASGTDQQAGNDYGRQLAAHYRDVFAQGSQPVDASTDADQRFCVTCGQPIVREDSLTWRHYDTRFPASHPAQPRLAHPMDADPFAGIDDEPMLCDGCDSTDKPVQATDDGRALLCADCRQLAATAVEPVFPPAEPEPSMSLAQFQRRVAAGEWNGTPAPKPAPAAPSGYSLAVLGGVNQLRHVYAGTADPHKVARRRAKNRMARRSRRINRGR